MKNASNATVNARPPTAVSTTDTSTAKNFTARKTWAKITSALTKIHAAGGSALIYCHSFASWANTNRILAKLSTATSTTDGVPPPTARPVGSVIVTGESLAYQ